VKMNLDEITSTRRAFPDRDADLSIRSPED
jgi:hypothetical protein